MRHLVYGTRPASGTAKEALGRCAATVSPGMQARRDAGAAELATTAPEAKKAREGDAKQGARH